ncbi:HAD-IA family hydrolase [Paenibacillus sedimenti]|uniref:HAD-IA family hydrolase n=1 Tax=Paenibacillus sedimenti TaxID=2770274 RepID=A0A926QHI8_9BACL|nr:HAD-IA family hydrolase [Paenibacillus sedimenti]MBD0379601.1 HAD-IA family hydrolase [Paenibacillus sedimenti]
MKKVIVFDFDGTLVHSRPLAIQIFNELAEKYGCTKIEEHLVEEYAKLNIRDRLKALKCPIHKLPRLLLDARKRYKSSVVGLNLISGIEDVLRTLKQMNIRIGILSSNAESNIRHFLQLNGIEFFDYVYCASNLFGKDKAIAKMVKELSLKTEDVVYVGDEIRDIEACKKVNVTSVAVIWGYDSEELILKGKPDFIVHHPEEIARIVQGGNI